MWRSALDIARRAAALAGLILNLASMVLLILDPPLAVPAGIIAAGGVAFGTAVLGWAYLDARNERDAVQAKLDDRERVKAAQAEALKAFHDRLFEGTEVLRRILPWKRFPDDLSLDGRNAMEAERIALYTKLVSDWNEACLATAGTHLPHRKWLLQRPVDYAPAVQTKVPIKVVRLREEVREKINRLDGLQQELTQQSGR